MITDRQLALIAPNASRRTRTVVLAHLNETLSRYSINTLTRVAAFLANVLVESGEFRYTEEIWGNTAAQRRYDVGRKARELGNTPEADGDGEKFKGHGWIQTTGRRNHERVGKHLGIDAVTYPELLGQYPYCAFSAGFFWQDNKLNRLADLLEGDWDAEEQRIFSSIVRAVNGGQMHLKERVAYYRRACHVLRTVPGFDPKPVAPAPSALRPAEAVAEEDPPVPPAVEPNPVAQSATSTTVAPAGTVCNADDQQRQTNTRIIDYAAQQITPHTAKTFGRSLWARTGGPILRVVMLAYAALEAGNVAAWLGLVVLALAVVYVAYRYRRNLQRYAVEFYHAAERRLVSE